MGKKGGLGLDPSFAFIKKGQILFDVLLLAVGGVPLFSPRLLLCKYQDIKFCVFLEDLLGVLGNLSPEFYLVTGVTYKRMWGGCAGHHFPQLPLAGNSEPQPLGAAGGCACGQST